LILSVAANPQCDLIAQNGTITSVIKALRTAIAQYHCQIAEIVNVNTAVSTIFRTFDWAERRPALAQAVMAPVIC
jgi:hypothetical protein